MTQPSIRSSDSGSSPTGGSCARVQLSMATRAMKAINMAATFSAKLSPSSNGSSGAAAASDLVYSSFQTSKYSTIPTLSCKTRFYPSNSAAIPFQPPADQPLTAVANECDLTTRAYIETMVVGQTLPDMPLFLEPDGCIMVPLGSYLHDGVFRISQEVVVHAGANLAALNAQLQGSS